MHFIVPGPPRGKGRHRVDTRGKRPRQYTDKQTEEYEQKVAHEWSAAGRVYLGEGPIGGQIVAAHRRPASHLRVGGALTAKGLEQRVPIRKPDASNVIKVVEDALNGLCYRDDAQIVDIHFERRWCSPGEDEHVDVQLWTVEAPAPRGQSSLLEAA